MKQRLIISVRGTRHEWNFQIMGDPKYLQEWRDDGLNVDELFHSIPEWVVNAKLASVWMFFEDLLYFRNPFRS